MTHRSQTLLALLPRSAVSLLLIASLTFNATAQSSGMQTRTVTLKQGQVLEMKLKKRLDSGRNKVGDDVVLTLTKPLMAEGVAVLPAKWVVHGRVTDVKRAAKGCQAGSIRWELESAIVAGSNKIAIESIGAETANQRLIKEAEQDAPSSAAGKKTGANSESSAGSTAMDLVLLPVGIFFFASMVLSEVKYGEGESCRGTSKGREESVPKNSTFYAEISKETQAIAGAPLK